MVAGQPVRVQSPAKNSRGMREAAGGRTSPGIAENVALTSFTTCTLSSRAWRTAGRNSPSSRTARSTTSCRGISTRLRDALTTPKVKHLAATNYILAAGILRQPPPADAGNETGPETVRTKTEIITYLKGSFAALHKAVAAIDDQNTVIENVPISPLVGVATRLGLAEEALIHIYDHYGQMVVYLRMNGIIPPSSR